MTRLAMLALLLLAFALRVYGLGSQSIWVDEGFVVGLASRSLPELLGVWGSSPQEGYASFSRLGADLVGLAPETDIHPPLYYFLVHFWLPLAGRSEFALRFPAALFGILTIPALFALGKRLLGERAALLASAIGAVSPFYLDFSQQVRMYTLVTFLALLSMYSFQRAFQEGRRRYWVLYAFFTALALYTHYFAITVVVAQAIQVLNGTARGRGRSQWGLWLVSQLGALLLLAPWLPYALRQVSDYRNRSLLIPDWQTVLTRTWQAFNLGLSVDGSQVGLLLLAILAVLLVGLALAWWKSQAARAGLVALLLYLIVPLMVGLAIFRFKPMFHPKYFMMASPAYYLLLGAALYGFWRHLPWASILAGLVVVAALVYGVQAYYFDSRYWKDDTRAVARYLEARATSQDLVLSDLPEPLAYYYAGKAPAYYLPGEESTAPQWLASLAGGRQRVFLVHYEHAYTDAQGLIPFLLERAGEKLDEKGFRGYSLGEYQLRPGASFKLAPGRNLPTSFEDKLVLEGWQVGTSGSSQDVTSPAVPSGGQLWAILDWRLGAPSPSDYKASLYLVDERGHLAAQGDKLILRQKDPTSRWMPGEAARNYYLLPVFPGVVPGQYSLRLRAYEALQPGQSGSLATTSLRFLGDEADLGKVAVVAPTRPAVFSPQDMGTSSQVQLGALDGLGYTMARRQYKPGETLALTLFLRAHQAPQEDYRFRFQLVDEQGTTRWQWGFPLLFPTSRWGTGDSFRDWQDLPLPANLPSGEYRLWAGLAPASEAGGAWPWDLGAIQVVDRPRLTGVPPITRPLRAELEGRVALLGYDLEGDLKPGSTVRLTLYWQGLAPMDESYTVFAHLLDANGRIWAQHDGVPAGDSPTSGWLEGEVVLDRHALTIRGDASLGEYVLEVGMYEPRSGRRLAVSAGQAEVVDRALWLQRLQVR